MNKREASFVEKGRKNVNSDTFLLRWMNSLDLGAWLNKKNLCTSLQDGILLSRLLLKLKPSINFVGFNMKPQTNILRQKNLDMILNVMYKESVHRPKLQNSSVYLVTTNTQVWLALIDEIFEAFVVRKINTRKILFWYLFIEKLIYLEKHNYKEPKGIKHLVTSPEECCKMMYFALLFCNLMYKGNLKSGLECIDLDVFDKSVNHHDRAEVINMMDVMFGFNEGENGRCGIGQCGIPVYFTGSEWMELWHDSQFPHEALFQMFLVYQECKFAGLTVDVLKESMINHINSIVVNQISDAVEEEEEQTSQKDITVICEYTEAEEETEHTSSSKEPNTNVYEIIDKYSQIEDFVSPKIPANTIQLTETEFEDQSGQSSGDHMLSMDSTEKHIEENYMKPNVQNNVMPNEGMATKDEQGVTQDEESSSVDVEVEEAPASKTKEEETMEMTPAPMMLRDIDDELELRPSYVTAEIQNNSPSNEERVLMAQNKLWIDSIFDDKEREMFNKFVQLPFQHPMPEYMQVFLIKKHCNIKFIEGLLKGVPFIILKKKPHLALVLLTGNKSTSLAFYAEDRFIKHQNPSILSMYRDEMPLSIEVISEKGSCEKTQKLMFVIPFAEIGDVVVYEETLSIIAKREQFLGWDSKEIVLSGVDKQVRMFARFLKAICYINNM